MKRNIIVTLIAIGCALLLQSCASTRLPEMSAVVSSGQKIGFEETIFSQKKHYVSLSPYKELAVVEGKTMFVLGIQSGGDTPFDVGYGSVSVSFQDSATILPRRITIQTYEEFLSDLWEDQRRDENRYIRDSLEDINYKLEVAVARNFSNVLASSSSSSTSSDSSSSSDSSMDTTQMDVEGMLDELELDIESMRINNQVLRDAIPDIIMRPGTVMPGDTYSALVVCDTRKLDEKMEGRFQVAVRVDGEQHIFNFNRVLDK